MTPVHILIIGAGDRGNTHASYTKALPVDMNIVAVAAPDPNTIATFAIALMLQLNPFYQP